MSESLVRHGLDGYWLMGNWYEVSPAHSTTKENKMCDSGTKIKKMSSKLYSLTKEAAERISSLDDCLGKVMGKRSEIKMGKLMAEEVTAELEILYREGKKLVKKLEEAVSQAKGKWEDD